MKYIVCLSAHAIERATAILDALMPGVPLERALEAELNPNGRGILITKENDDPLTARLWGTHLALYCHPLEKHGAFRATGCSKSDPARFAQQLVYGRIFPGDWIFTDRSKGIKDFSRAESVWRDIKDIPFSRDSNREFWSNRHQVCAERREHLDSLESVESCRFTDAKALADQDLIVFALVSKELTDEMKNGLIEGVAVKACLAADDEEPETYFKVGKVDSLDLEKGLLFVVPQKELNWQDYEKRLPEDNQPLEGIVRIDRSGEYAILARQEDAIYRLNHHQSANRNLPLLMPDCSGADSALPLSSPPFPLSQGGLTRAQHRVVCSVMAEPDLFLIQGPPGTGKTTVISELVSQMVRRGEKVLVSSQANVAVDNVLERVGALDYVTPVRIGDAEVVEEGCRRYLLDNAVYEWQEKMKQCAEAGLTAREEAYEDPDKIRTRISSLRNGLSALAHLQDLVCARNALRMKHDTLTRRLSVASSEYGLSEAVVTFTRTKLHKSDMMLEEYSRIDDVKWATGWSIEQLKRVTSYAVACKGKLNNEKAAEHALQEVLGYKPTRLATRSILSEISQICKLVPDISQFATHIGEYDHFADFVQAEKDRDRAYQVMREIETEIQTFRELQDDTCSEIDGILKSNPEFAEFLDEFGFDLDAPDAPAGWDVAVVEREIADLAKSLQRTGLHNRTKDIISDWIESLSVYQSSFEKPYLNRVNVVASTCMRIAGTRHNAFSDMDFDWVIIDESARCEALELLVPMVRGKRIVLLGDHKQLPPQRDRDLEKRLESSKVIKPEAYQELIDESLFSRLYTSAPVSLREFLDVQFRMHPEISGLIKGFYDDRLHDGRGTDTRDHGLWDLWPGNVFWVTTSAMDENTEIKKSPNHPSFGNRAEVNAIRHILEELDLAYSNLDPRITKTVGVITGYAYQRDLLRNACSGKGHEPWGCLDVEINTIDAFQGREKNIVILSLVRSNTRGKMGFISVDPRVNVALSRAQELLIIVGDDQFIDRYPNKAARLGFVLEELRNMGRIRNGLEWPR